MAESRSRPKQTAHRKGNLRVWDVNDRLELLAYLNWCAEVDVDFQTTAVDHLKKTTGKDFSPRQIKDRLRLEWKNYGNTECFEQVYELGTAALLSGRQDDDERIEEALHRLGPRPVDRYNLRGVASRLKTRSRTLSTVSSPRETRSAVPRQAPSLPRTPYPSDKDQISKHRETVEATSQVLTASATNNSHSRDTSNEDVKVEELGCSPVPAIDSSGHELIGPPSLSVIQHQSSQSRMTAQILEVESKLERTETELLKQQASVFTLRNKLYEKQRELEDMRSCSQSGVAEDQFKLQQRICSLQARHEARGRLLDNLKDLKRERICVRLRNIQQEYSALYQEIYDFCSFISDLDTNAADLSRQQAHQHEPAQVWAKTVSNWTLDAAIFELVFEPIFPNILALDSPLLHQYRKYIFTTAGCQVLRQSDLAALQGLTSEEYFKSEILPEKSESLARVIGQSLQLLLPSKEKYKSDGSLPPEYLQNFLAELVHPLTLALNLKVSLDLSDALLKFVFFKPGEAFNADTMIQDTSQPASSADSNHVGGQRVQLCLLPALFALPAGDYDEHMEDNFTQFSADCNNRFTKAESDNVDSFILLAKATVML
ncbi:hypothetical protein QQS21_004629 [Conoideocrella luteorostrata]|uniref:Uncharacterized protein n=1 Tax=Conoideocrella luteorostrata TaxID=1105319 RepID=A0AAJ0FZQ0_9HYPO|nr:hypothetical protein QQS21_004629 [Conoideocrella luteorostrata]